MGANHFAISATSVLGGSSSASLFIVADYIFLAIRYRQAGSQNCWLIVSHMTALPHIVTSADHNLHVHSLHFDVTFDPTNEVQAMAWPALAPAQEVK